MVRKTQPKSDPGCKVILFRRSGITIQFGLIPNPPDDLEIPAMPLPDLLMLEPALMEFATTELRVRTPRVHAKFVGRPHRDGWLYYLVEETHAPNGLASSIVWDIIPALATRVAQQDRKALVLAVRFLGEG